MSSNLRSCNRDTFPPHDRVALISDKDVTKSAASCQSTDWPPDWCISKLEASTFSEMHMFFVHALKEYSFHNARVTYFLTSTNTIARPMTSLSTPILLRIGFHFSKS